MNVYLLTPTGCRPEGLALLGEYINAQTYKGPMTWVVVDDCEPATRTPRVREDVTVVEVRPSWCWSPGDNTQAQCLSLGLEKIPGDATVLVMEDDDIYCPGHVDNLVTSLENVEMVGERVSRYYNVTSRRYRSLPGTVHASLASTGVRGTGLQALRNVCTAMKTRIDITLWREFSGSKKLLDTTNVVGIKGLPGRPGIGVGHRRNFGTVDSGTVLQQWAGELADNYKVFGEVL